MMGLERKLGFLKRSLAVGMIATSSLLASCSGKNNSSNVMGPKITQPVNHAPSKPSVNINVDESQNFSQQVNSTDPDGDHLDYSGISGPSWAGISLSGLISGTAPQVNADKTFLFPFKITDGHYDVYDTARINVKNVTTKVLSPAQISQIALVNDTSLYFSAQEDFQVGDVLVSDTTAKTPYGFLSKVVSVSPDHKIFLTKPATLEDALGENSFAISKTFSSSDVASSQNAPGVSAASASVNYSFPYAVGVTLDNAVGVYGNISFNAGLDLSGDFNLEKFLFQMHFGESVDLTATSNTASVIPAAEKKLTTLSLKTQVYILPNGFPIVYRPKIDVIVGIKPSTISTLESRVVQSTELSPGISYDPVNGWQPLADFSSNFNIDPPTLSGQTNIEVYAKLQPEIVLYRGFFPSPDAAISAGLHFTGSSAQNFELDGKLGAFVGIDMGFFSSLIPNYSKQVMDYTKVLAQSQNQPPSSNSKLLFSMGPQAILSQSDYPQIYSINEDGSGLAKLTNLPYTNFNNFQPSGFPSQNKFVFVSNKDGNLELYTFDLGNSQITRLTNNGSLASNSDYEPSVSPDGSEVAFISNRNATIPNMTSGLYIMNADGSNQGQIPTPNLYNVSDPSWSPDGSKITFDATQDGSDYNLYSVDLSSDVITPLTQGNLGLNLEPSWSPDGSKITFMSDRDGNREIYMMNPDGSGLQRMTNNSTIDVYPVFSSDGKDIFFLSQRSGYSQLYSIDLGSMQTSLVPTKNSDDIYSLQRWE